MHMLMEKPEVDLADVDSEELERIARGEAQKMAEEAARHIYDGNLESAQALFRLAVKTRIVADDIAKERAP